MFLPKSAFLVASSYKILVFKLIKFEECLSQSLKDCETKRTIVAEGANIFKRILFLCLPWTIKAISEGKIVRKSGACS